MHEKEPCRILHSIVKKFITQPHIFFINKWVILRVLFYDVTHLDVREFRICIFVAIVHGSQVKINDFPIFGQLVRFYGQKFGLYWTQFAECCHILHRKRTKRHARCCSSSIGHVKLCQILCLVVTSISCQILMICWLCGSRSEWYKCRFRCSIHQHSHIRLEHMTLYYSI